MRSPRPNPPRGSQQNIVPIAAKATGVSFGTVVLSLVALGGLGGLGYAIWRLMKDPASLERQSKAQSEAQDLAEREQQQAGTQAQAAAQEAAKRAAATGTDQLKTVTFDLLPYTNNGLTTSYMHMTRRIELPIDTPKTLVNAEGDYEFEFLLIRAATTGDLLLSVKARKTNVLGSWGDRLDLWLKREQTSLTANIGTLPQLQQRVTRKERFEFFNHEFTPDVGVTVTPVTWSYK